MALAMTAQEAVTALVTCINEAKVKAAYRHDADIEVNQVAVVLGCSLGAADPVGVVAGGAGTVLLNDMFQMIRERLIS